jgi:cysteine-rich repeat protein
MRRKTVTVNTSATGRAGKWPRLAGLVLAGALLVVPLSAIAAAPTTVLFEGVLSGAGGAPAADGDYKLTFALYAKKGDANALWSETVAAVKVVGGAFSHALGSATPVPDAVWKGAGEGFLGVQVASEPELPRVALAAVAFARRAALAEGIDCSGCVPVAALLFDGDVDVGGNSIKAKNLVLTGDLSAKTMTAQSVSAQTVTAQSFVGDGSKLTGLALPSGDCKSGEVVVGIAADGKLKCKISASAGGELSVLTGGLLTNRLTTTASPPTLPMAIPDNTGLEAAAIAVVTESGNIEKITVTLAIDNSDLAKVRAVLLPPDDKQVGITLCDPCGGTNEKKLDAVYPPTKVKSGDLSAYIGKSAKGTWTLKVLDSGFCIPQLPGNAGICDVNKGLDGVIKGFSVTVEVLSTTAVSVPGSLVASGTFQLPADLAPPPTCDLKSKGSTFVDTKLGRLVVCDGGDWRTLPFEKACGNAIASGEEECDDGNGSNTDNCTNACKLAVCGDGFVHTDVEVCDDSNTKDGDACSADCKQALGKKCSNGAYGDCNPAGQTLIAKSAFVDNDPPAGWAQCMGFINTSGDDVGTKAMDNCLNSTQLRLRIWDAGGKLVVDVYETGLKSVNAWWGSAQYYDGCNCGVPLTTAVCGTLWPCGNNAGFYGSTNGAGGGGSSGFTNGSITLSNGNGGQVTVDIGHTTDRELWTGPSYGNTAYPNYTIAVYKQP